MNDRTCIVTRKVLPREAMIRFAVGPDGKVYPDLKAQLPGRGVWVSADRSAVTQAVDRKLFARGFKQSAIADPDVPELVGRLLIERGLQALAMCRKAGLLVTGFSKADAAIRSNQAQLVLHASDAAADGRRKLAQAIAFVGHIGGEPVAVMAPFSSDQMNKALGLANVMHAVALHGGATNALLAAIRRLNEYERVDAAALEGDEND